MLCYFTLMDANQKQNQTCRRGAKESEHVASFMGHKLIQVTSERDTNQNRKRLGRLNVAPGTGKISGTHSFIDVNFEGVVVATGENA